MVESDLRVRYSETDRMGIVYHAHYIVWFEIGRTEFCRAGGVPYRELEDGGLFILVTGVHCTYRQPARYDDPIRVLTALPLLSRRGMDFLYEVHGEAGRLANGISRHVFADAHGRPTRAPQAVIEKLESFRSIGV